MKRLLVGLVAFSMVFMGTGCKKEEISISSQDVTSNTIVVFEDGTMQSSVTSVFDKDYYEIDDLSTYISDDLATFNSDNNTNIKLNSISLNGGNAVAVFDYDNSSDFSTYVSKGSLYVAEENAGTEELSVTAQLMSASDAKSSDLVPGDINKYGKSKTKSKSKALKDKYKVFVLDNTSGALDGSIDITVDGEIDYSYNVSKVDDNTVNISDLEGVAVIVFKP